MYTIYLVFNMLPDSLGLNVSGENSCAWVDLFTCVGAYGQMSEEWLLCVWKWLKYSASHVSRVYYVTNCMNPIKRFLLIVFGFTACQNNKYSSIYSHFLCFPNEKFNSVTHFFLLFTALSHLVEQSPSQIARIHSQVALYLRHFVDHNTLLRWGLCTREWIDRPEQKPNGHRAKLSLVLLERKWQHCCSLSSRPVWCSGSDPLVDAVFFSPLLATVKS